MILKFQATTRLQCLMILSTRIQRGKFNRTAEAFSHVKKLQLETVFYLKYRNVQLITGYQPQNKYSVHLNLSFYLYLLIFGG